MPAARLPGWLRQHLAALRALLVMTALVGLAYPLVITGIAQIPGLKHRADGSLVTASDGQVVGSAIIGQNFLDKKGNPLPQYFQPRPSAAGAAGYDPTATSASNLGPESVVDTLDDPAALAVFHVGPGYAGAARRVVGINEECGVVDKPFLADYQGVTVECHKYGDDVSAGQLVLIRGDAPAHPAVPADAVTASGSGLDPAISPAYAELQAAQVAKARNLPKDRVEQLIRERTANRALGFLGEPAVNVLLLNLDLDRLAPLRR